MATITVSKSQAIVNKTLATFLSEQKKNALTIHPSYGRLYDEIERVVFAGGKRLRPHMVFLSCGSYGESIAKVAAAHELLHVALLIHDDIIDRDTLRHGQATIHHNYDTIHYTPFLDDQNERHHFSTSAALLAGDLLISSAYELLRRANLDASNYQKVTQLMSTGIFEVAGGELLDTEAPFISGKYTPVLVYRYKTTSYSFIAPLLSGASLSNHASAEDLEKVRTCATNLGIAYQIKDDYLGIFGETTKTGKSTVSDLREGKQTLLIAEFKKIATPKQLQLFKKSFGKTKATEDELVLLKKAIKESGAPNKATEIERAFNAKALRAAQEIENIALRENMLGLITFLNERDA